MILTNLSEANQVLLAYIPTKTTEAYTLDRMQQMLALLGNPQDSYKSVHVAGTSGKTSTAYYAAALLKEAGYKVGLTVSPHVAEVNERAQINFEPFPEAAFCKALGKLIDILKKAQFTPTYFELLVCLAFWIFAQEKVDYGVIEVGKGGLLDGTNTITRADKVCIITDIGLDHIDVLGNTLAEIAGHKAGIIHAGNEAFAYYQSPEVDQVFREKADEVKAQLHLLNPKTVPPELDFLPLFQQRNFDLAQTAIDYVLQRDGLKALTADQVTKAAHTSIPGRMEEFQYHNKLVILDGAHNAQKIRALCESVRQKYPDQKIVGVVSFTAGEDYRYKDSVHELTSILDFSIITTFSGAQDTPKFSVDTTELTTIFDESHSPYAVVAEPTEALAQALVRPESIVLVVGSFSCSTTLDHLC